MTIANYIKLRKKQGWSKEKIKKFYIKQGHSKEEVENAFILQKLREDRGIKPVGYKKTAKWNNKSIKGNVPETNLDMARKLVKTGMSNNEILKNYFPNTENHPIWVERLKQARKELEE